MTVSLAEWRTRDRVVLSAVMTTTSELPPAVSKPARLEARKRELRGVSVEFYKTRPGGCWMMNFKVRGRHVERNTDMTTLADAEAVAKVEIERRQKEHHGIGPVRPAVEAEPVATVGEVLAGLDSPAGYEYFRNAGTRRAYATGLRQLARAARPGEDVEGLGLDVVLAAEVLEGFQAERQGFSKPIPKRAMRENGGANTTIRNVKALLSADAVTHVFGGLHFGEALEALRQVTMLKPVSTKFVPWPEAAYRAFDEAAGALRGFDAEGELRPGMLVKAVYLPREHAAREVMGKTGVLLALEGGMARVQWVWRGGEVVVHELPPGDLRAEPVDYAEFWLVGAMLRRLGLRCAELLAARRHWLERVVDGRDGRSKWMLVLRNRPEEGWVMLKNSAPRSLPLDDELASLLLGRGPGFLIGPGMSATGRQDMVERLHNAWLRQFIPDRVKANHELRMWAGSLVLRSTGSLVEAQKFLGHCSQATTEAYYAAWWQSAVMLDGAAVAAVPAAVMGSQGDGETGRQESASEVEALRARLAVMEAELRRLQGAA